MVELDNIPKHVDNWVVNIIAAISAAAENHFGWDSIIVSLQELLDAIKYHLSDDIHLASTQIDYCVSVSGICGNLLSGGYLDFAACAVDRVEKIRDEFNEIAAALRFTFPGHNKYQSQFSRA